MLDILCRTLLLALGCLASTTLQAVDCTGTGAGTITYLLSQADVDNFQTIYGPCDRVAGTLEIRSWNGPITDLSPLEDLVEVAEFLGIEGGFTSLDGLHNLVSAGTISIEGTETPLTDLTGLGSLTSAWGLHVLGLGNLQDLTGAPNLGSLESLRLSNLDGLVDLSGLTGLKQATSIRLNGLWTLTDLSGLPAALEVESLFIEDMQNLTSLNGLPAMTGLEHVSLAWTFDLADISELANSTFITDAPDHTSFELTNNSGLTNLVGVPIGEKFGYIRIESNSGLTSLAGLENLVELWSGLDIVNNEQLNDCSTLATVLDAIDDGDPGPGDGINPDDPPDTPGLDSINITDNVTGCNSIEEILAGGESRVIHEDGFEGKGT